MTDAPSSAMNNTATTEVAARDDARARAILRGTQRLLRSLNFESLSEVSLANGRRADVLAVGRDGETWIIEIKSSIADFRTDQKWHEYLRVLRRLAVRGCAGFSERNFTGRCGSDSRRCLCGRAGACRASASAYTRTAKSADAVLRTHGRDALAGAD